MGVGGGGGGWRDSGIQKERTVKLKSTEQIDQMFYSVQQS